MVFCGLRISVVDVSMREYRKRDPWGVERFREPLMPGKWRLYAIYD